MIESELISTRLEASAELEAKRQEWQGRPDKCSDGVLSGPLREGDWKADMAMRFIAEGRVLEAVGVAQRATFEYLNWAWIDEALADCQRREGQL